MKKSGVLVKRGMAILAISLLAWIVARSWLITRELQFTLRANNAPRMWSLQWSAGTGHAPNGVWIDAWTLARDEIEIRLPGKRADNSVYRLWLDRVRPVGGEPIDLRAHLSSGGVLEGHWEAFGSGGGIAFRGPDPGVLRLQVPAGAVELTFARTADGGEFAVRRAGVERTLGNLAPSDERTTQLIDASGDHPLSIDGDVRVRLPNYSMGRFELLAHGEGDITGAISGARVRTRLAGRLLRDEPVEFWSKDGGHIEKSDSRFVADPSQPSPELQGRTCARMVVSAGVGLQGHALGLACVVVVTAALWTLFAAVRRVSERARPRWLTPELVVLAMVVAAHLWMSIWAPVMYCPDSIDYAGTAVDWLNGKPFPGGYQTVRVPGYPVFLAILWKLVPAVRFNEMLAFVQGTLSVLTALLSYAIARRITSRPWATLVMALVGLSPILLAWQRYVMSESLSGFILVLVVWLATLRGRFGLISGERGERSPLWYAVALAALVGFVGAGGAYVRGNFQLVVALAPLLIVLAAWRERGRIAAIALGAAAFIGGVAPLVPRVLANQRDHGIAAFMVGSSYAQLLLGEPNGTIDLNQTGLLDFEQWKKAADGRSSRALSEWDLLPIFQASKLAPIPPGRRNFGIDEARFEVLARESYARRADTRLDITWACFANILGLNSWHPPEEDVAAVRRGEFPPWRPLHGFRENDYWTGPLRGIRSTDGSNFFAGAVQAKQFTPGREEVYAACRRDITPRTSSVQARVFDEWYQGERALRPLIALLVLAALGVALVRRDWVACWIALAILAHAGALAVLAMTGIDRYAIPFEPLSRVAAVYGLAGVVAWWRKR